MKITATFEIEADVDGWARAKSSPHAAAALHEILSFLRAMDPVSGQTFLALQTANAHVDLDKQ